MKILYLVHGHEQFSVGGAENAAFSLFREAQKYPEIEAWILAAVHTSTGILAHGELRSMDHSDREYLIGTSCEWFKFANSHIPSMRRSLKRLLDHIQPDIIHIQHYVHFGIDIIPLLQSLCPDAKVIVTLHEYLALCRHNGQMVKTQSLKLCEQGTPLACSMCYPEHSSASFFLRHHFIKNILESCNALVSPSSFLIQRYKDCGISHLKFVMIENGLPFSLDPSAVSSSDLVCQDRTLNRFAYFGQLNIYKGCLLLLKAAALLQDRGITNFTINIYGANLENQPLEFQEQFNCLHHQVKDVVKLNGSYKQSELNHLMINNDWIVFPSIWWENSPVVIQEAFYYKKPIIGADIGGIAEKIVGLGGATFSARSENSLADVMQKSINNHSLHQALQSQMLSPFTSKQCLEMHLKLYKSL